MKAYWSPSLVLLFFNIGVFCSIGQAIRIESAYYGPPNRTGVDVTRRVQRFADYGEPFRVGSDTLRIDSSPNHPKSLVVIYEIDGQRISDCVPEGEVFYFKNGAEPESNRSHRSPAMQIIRALYGTRSRYVDVTRLVRQLVRDRQPFTVSNQTFGVDPYQGRQKWLKISYLCGHSQREQQYKEGTQLRLQ
jgi:hypothetical protein